MIAVFFFAAAVVSAPALAQTLSGLPPCAQTCALNAVGSSGCPVTDAACICESTVFISAFSACIATSCNATDAAAATSFGVQFCASAGVTLGTASAPQATTRAATGGSVKGQ